MPENMRPRFESGDTVNSLSELIEALYRQPKGFRVQINLWYGDHHSMWGKAENQTGQKLAMTMKKLYTHDGKPACLVEFMVL